MKPKKTAPAKPDMVGLYASIPRTLRNDIKIRAAEENVLCSVLAARLLRQGLDDQKETPMTDQPNTLFAPNTVYLDPVKIEEVLDSLARQGALSAKDRAQFCSISGHKPTKKEKSHG